MSKAARKGVETNFTVPPAAVSKGAAAKFGNKAARKAASSLMSALAGQGVAHQIAAAPPPVPDSTANDAMDTRVRVPSTGEASVSPDAIAALVALQRQRHFCIVSQGRIDRACEAFIARALGFTTEASAADRKSVFTRAIAFRREVEGKGGEGHHDCANLAGSALSACTPVVLHSAAAREIWDKHRINLEAEMQRLAKTLPAWSWAAGVRGLSLQGLACIIGETGDLAAYATKERVWKRLGLAVIDGVAQQRRTNAEQAAVHGFSPKRRATVWVIADVLLRQQWRGGREGKPAHAVGPYGAVYGRRKAHTVNRDGWTPKHRDNDARRVMSKALIEDLWRVWRGMEPLASMPPSASLA